jgi:hypothetical protein
MAETLVGRTLNDLRNVIEDLGHPRTLLLSSEDFFNIFHGVNQVQQQYDQTLGPFMQVMSTKVFLASWPKERPECIDLSEASEVSKRLHPPKRANAVPFNMTKAQVELLKAIAQEEAQKAGLPGVGVLRGATLGQGIIAKRAYAELTAQHDMPYPTLVCEKCRYSGPFSNNILGCPICGSTELIAEQR